jgi:hypothetical protein
MITALGPLIAFVVKIFLYFTALQLRKLEARWMTAAMCAGASVLAGLFPLPELIQFVVIVAIAGFFIAKNTEADLYKDSIGIPVVVEIAAAFVIGYAVMPLIEMVMQ